MGLEANYLLSLINETERSRWLDLVIQKRQQLLEWVSTFHPQGLICRVEDRLYHGAYNLGQKVNFTDGTQWLIRFPLYGHVSPECADEKVAMEVTAMKLIRKKTTIPVPEIKHWGLAAENPLDLGPFIIMDFIEGVPLDSLLMTPDVKEHGRLIREDVSEDMMETIYRQFAKILLELYQLDFDCIGSLPASETGYHAPARPLTFKAHDILIDGGVNTFGNFKLVTSITFGYLLSCRRGDRSKGFSTTTEYFRYVIEQDWKQLLDQPNSIDGEREGKSSGITMYESLSALKTLIPTFIHPEYDKSRFKLICDDLSMSSMIVRSKDDLTVVGLVDLEWSYVGPAQLFGSVPWWLVGIRLTHLESYYDKNCPDITARFLKYLKIFKRVLKEEETGMPGHEDLELSNLVEWSETSGAMWLHMLLSCGFNHPWSLPFEQLQQFIGSEKWTGLKRQFEDQQKVFMDEKTPRLEKYFEDEDMAVTLRKEFESGVLARDDYIAALAALVRGRV